METERMELSARERERLKVLQQVEEGHLKQVEAARRLHLTDRHVRRLQARLHSEGDRGIVHGLRGSSSNRKIREVLRQRAVRELRQARYAGFGPTLAASSCAMRRRALSSAAPWRSWTSSGSPLTRRRPRGASNAGRIPQGAILVEGGAVFSGGQNIASCQIRAGQPVSLLALGFGRFG